MKSFRVFIISAALCISSFQFVGWQACIQLVHGEEKIDFSKIELDGSERKVILDKAIKFYKGYPGGPEAGMPMVGKEDIKDLTLGDTLKIFHIRMDRIRDYRREMDPKDVLVPAEGGIVAINPPNQPPGDKSNILSFAPLIRIQEEKSKNAKYQAGWPRNLPDYDLLFQAWKEIENEKTGQPFGIFNPATGKYFLGYESEGGEFKIIVLHNGPGGLQKYQKLKAEDAFVELAKDANQKKLEYEATGNPLERFRQFQSGQ